MTNSSCLKSSVYYFNNCTLITAHVNNPERRFSEISIFFVDTSLECTYMLEMFVLRGVALRSCYPIAKGIGNRNTNILDGVKQMHIYAQEPFHPIPGKEPVWKTAEDAITIIKSSECVMIDRVRRSLRCW